MGKKRKHVESKQAESKLKPTVLEAERKSDDPPLKKAKWINRERVLVFSTRGISFRDRHLMNDFRTLMPHTKQETKLDRKDNLFVVNEIAEMKNCKKCIFFEAKVKKDLYMWVSNIPDGPSARFCVENIHTMRELKMTGNCLKGSRPLLSFDKKFDESPHWALLKELFTQVFGTPNHCPKSQPFVDHVFTFTITDNRIWFRNYQILEDNAALAEIGPRLVLNPIRIFQGSFGGPTLYQNPHYISPNKYRSAMKRQKGDKYTRKVEAKKLHKSKRGAQIVPDDITSDVFQT